MEWNYEIKKKIRMFGEKETYKYLGILEADTIKQVEMKEKIKKKDLRRTRKLLEIFGTILEVDQRRT